jgi:alpha-glucoside transport system substrate-binding protein
MKRLLLIIVVIALAGLMVACNGTTAEQVAPTIQAAVEDIAPTLEVAVEEIAPTLEVAVEDMTADGNYLERAKAGEFAGSTVTVWGVMVDEEAIKMEQALAPFEEATGIDVVYEGSREFETQINVAVDGGAPPDIANISQPGMAARFASAGELIDVSAFLPREKLQETYIDSWIDMSTMPDDEGNEIITGVWQRAAAKSMVFYNKKAFEEAGYEIPETWDEMVALTEEIAADGDPAWCIGIESGPATGWVVTDWMENIMLRTTSLENYDAWVEGELPFASPEVKAAAEKMSEIWLNDEYVYGGVPSIVSTFIGDSPVPMFEDPPGCWLHSQAAWITGFFGDESLVAGEDYDFFYLPPIDESLGRPALVAGDLMVMFNDRPEVRALMEFFSRAEGVEGWVRSGGTLSPHKDAELDWYTTYVDRKVAELLLDATSVRFDASDLMPAEVGAGSFWKAMTDWISGSTDLDTALDEIDASWPQ